MIKCHLCSMQTGNERHHIFSGHGTRNIADKYNLVAYLCPLCHQQSHQFKTPTIYKIMKYYGFANNTTERIIRIMKKSLKRMLPDEIETLEIACKSITEYINYVKY